MIFSEQYSKIPIAQTADPAGQKAVINAADCRRYGNLCFCYVDAYKTSGTLVSEEALFKLPWKPILNTYFAAVGRNTASGASGLIQAAIVAQTGIVCTVGEASAYNEVRCQIAYWSA